MTKKKDITAWFVGNANDWPAPHVRRLAPLVGMLSRAIEDAGLSIQIKSKRSAWIGGVYLVRFQHAAKNARQHNAVILQKGSQSGPVVFEAGAVDATSQKVADFCRNPRSVLRECE